MSFKFVVLLHNDRYATVTCTQVVSTLDSVTFKGSDDHIVALFYAKDIVGFYDADPQKVSREVPTR